MDPNLRNLKDFLGLYNKVTELCFNRCVDDLSDRSLLGHENTCVDNCVNKFARFNQLMMNVYVEVQTEINKTRMEEVEQLEQQKKAQLSGGGGGNTIPAAATSTTTTTTKTPAQPAASAWTT